MNVSLTERLLKWGIKILPQQWSYCDELGRKLPPRSEYNAALQTDGKIIPSEKICQKEMVGENAEYLRPAGFEFWIFSNTPRDNDSARHLTTSAQWHLREAKLANSIWSKTFSVNTFIVNWYQHSWEIQTNINFDAFKQTQESKFSFALYILSLIFWKIWFFRKVLINAFFLHCLHFWAAFIVLTQHKRGSGEGGFDVVSFASSNFSLNILSSPGQNIWSSVYCAVFPQQ